MVPMGISREAYTRQKNYVYEIIIVEAMKEVFKQLHIESPWV